MYLLLCIFSSVMAVLALSSWAAKQGNGFATDEVTGAIIGICLLYTSPSPRDS